MGADEIGPSGGSSIELWLAGGEEQVTQVALQRRVWDELATEALLASADLRVEVVDCVAILDGTVDGYLLKAAAERAARRVDGIRAVESRIQVQPSAAHAQTDADLAVAAARALACEVLAPTERIVVQVEAGIITLVGEVGRELQRDSAVRVVSRLAGVRDVRNEIALRPAARPERLEPRIRDALHHLHARHITFETHGDTVVLRGRVRSLAQRDDLEHAVWAVAGVAALVDHVEVAV